MPLDPGATTTARMQGEIALLIPNCSASYRVGRDYTFSDLAADHEANHKFKDVTGT